LQWRSGCSTALESGGMAKHVASKPPEIRMNPTPQRLRLQHSLPLPRWPTWARWKIRGAMNNTGFNIGRSSTTRSYGPPSPCHQGRPGRGGSHARHRHTLLPRHQGRPRRAISFHLQRRIRLLGPLFRSADGRSACHLCLRPPEHRRGADPHQLAADLGRRAAARSGHSAKRRRSHRKTYSTSLPKANSGAILSPAPDGYSSGEDAGEARSTPVDSRVGESVKRRGGKTVWLEMLYRYWSQVSSQFSI
jgi:hypothetical protein